MDGTVLSRQLRSGTGDHLEGRRGIVCLSLLASGCMGYIALYQMGVIRHLREPPLPRMDAERVDGAGEAYQKYQAPDAVVGLISYGTTALAAAAGGRDRARRHPWLPLAMLGKVLVDVVQAAKLSRQQWTHHRSFCFWCLGAAAATAAMLPLALSEGLAAARALRKRWGEPSRP